MLRRKDLLVIAGALLLALACYGGMRFFRSGQALSGFVGVFVDGAPYASVPLGETRTVRVAQDNGEINIVEIGAEGVRMAYSSCKNQLCIRQGEVTVENWTRRSMGRSIICLPNRIVAELSLSSGVQELIDKDAPDV